MSRYRALHSRCVGLAYVEAMVAVSVLAIALVPALDALSNATRNGNVGLSLMQSDLALRSKLDEVLTQPFSELYSETYLNGGNSTTAINAKYSDPVGPDRRVVILYRSSDGGWSSDDTDMVRIKVTWEGQSSGLDTLRTRWQ